jgi:2-oxoglutarate ferredoxin oxidoreductase subunit delta
MKSTIFDGEICKGCGLCVEICPKKIIILDKDKINKKGYHPAALKELDACTSCGQCAVICPHVAIKIEK